MSFLEYSESVMIAAALFEIKPPMALKTVLYNLYLVPVYSGVTKNNRSWIVVTKGQRAKTGPLIYGEKNVDPVFFYQTG